MYNAEYDAHGGKPPCRWGDEVKDDMDRDFESRLGPVFLAYKQSVVAPEVSPAFSTGVWAGIEARRSARLFGFWAKALSSCALAASLVFGVLTTPPAPVEPAEYVMAYLEGAPLASELELGYAVLEADSAQ